MNDPVHGYITISDFCLMFVDTPQFQRLRELKQLGMSYYVFPGATHARFEHCLGTSHLASKWINKLSNSQPELEITERDSRLVSLAGLCHDLGHGPFSHSFEHMVKVNKWVPWTHEQMSKDMLDYLIDDNNIDIEKEDINFVKALIEGKPTSCLKEKKFLFDIVSNSRNSIDVDKFDYLARDCHNLGIKYSHDSDRLIKFSRVIGEEICFNSKEVYNIYEMFHTRYSMHKQVYSHKVSFAIELMITDCLGLADPYLKIFDCINDPSQYMLLTDSILNRIESSKDRNLIPSQTILKRLRKRDLYKIADEVLIPEEKAKIASAITELNICSQGKCLRPHEIFLKKSVLNYAMKERNPVDNCHFFAQPSKSESFSIKKENVSLMIPDQFTETYLRIYVKNPEDVEVARESFRKCLKEKVGIVFNRDVHYGNFHH